MACVTRAPAHVAASHACNAAAAQDATVTEYYAAPPPSAPPQDWQAEAGALAQHIVVGLAQAAAAVREGAGGREGGYPLQILANVQNMDVHVHVHAHAPHHCNAELGPAMAPAPGFEHAAAPQLFQPNDPHFEAASSVRGFNFGRKVVKRQYRATRELLPQFNIMAYTQCSGNVQALSRAVTLGLSPKRIKQAMFFFDCVLPDWPESIHLEDLETLMQNLGATYEIHRDKVKPARRSLYLFLVKNIGVPLSDRGRANWNGLRLWAQYQLAPIDDPTSVPPADSKLLTEISSIGLTAITLLV